MTSAPTWDPHEELSRRPHLDLVWVDQGRRGCIDFLTGTIRVRRTDPPEVQTCVLSHELVHDERGPVPRWLKAREEHAVRHESSRRLIELHELAKALQWSTFVSEVALELGVDVPTLQARLIGLTDDERAVLDDHLHALGRDA